jgi:hypothetical protein
VAGILTAVNNYPMRVSGFMWFKGFTVPSFFPFFTGFAFAMFLSLLKLS